MLHQLEWVLAIGIAVVQCRRIQHAVAEEDCPYNMHTVNVPAAEVESVSVPGPDAFPAACWSLLSSYILVNLESDSLSDVRKLDLKIDAPITEPLPPTWCSLFPFVRELTISKYIADLNGNTFGSECTSLTRLLFHSANSNNFFVRPFAINGPPVLNHIVLEHSLSSMTIETHGIHHVTAKAFLWIETERLECRDAGIEDIPELNQMHLLCNQMNFDASAVKNIGRPQDVSFNPRTPLQPFIGLHSLSWVPPHEPFRLVNDRAFRLLFLRDNIPCTVLLPIVMADSEYRPSNMQQLLKGVSNMLEGRIRFYSPSGGVNDADRFMHRVLGFWVSELVAPVHARNLAVV